MGTNGPWNWRLTVPNTIKLMLLRPLMTNLKMTVGEDCAVSTCSPPPPVYKSSHPLLGVGWSRLLGRCPPPSPNLVASIWNKANFPFHQPGLIICFWVAGSQTPHTLLVTLFAEGSGSIPGQGTKIPQVAQCSQKRVQMINCKLALDSTRVKSWAVAAVALQRSSQKGGMLCSVEKLAGQVFRNLDIFRNWFYEPNSCISSYLGKH